MKIMKTLMGIAASAFVAASLMAHEGEDHAKKGGMGDDKEMTTVKGEVVDMACYIDHGATGEKHADCAKKCITSGLPVGIKAADGKTYLLIGEHKPINADLAEYAAKTITVKGKVASRDGFNMIENAEIQK